MLHVPKGTCTSFTLLELGLLPVHQEIDSRKLTFLHHILCLPVDDPVWIVYNEQKGYFNEPNWYNEVTELLKKYEIEESEEDIRSLSKASWKDIVKRAVRKHTVVTLYEECQSKSKTSNVPPYTELQQQKYFGTLNPSRARVYFQIRAGVYDVKVNRKYWYSDEVCRLCERPKKLLSTF